MPDVVINFASAGEANVVRAWAAQAAAAKAHNQTLGEAYNAAMRADSSLKQLSAAGTKGIRSVAGEVKSLAMGIIGGGGVLGAMGMWKSANEDILKQAHDTTLAYDELFRKFNIQSGLRGLAGSEAKEKLLDVAHERAVPEEVAAKAATQLVSSGYDVKEVVQGGAANEFLQGMNAMNQRGAGVDATSLAGAATSFMTAMGVQKDAAGMRGTMSSLFSAFQGTNIQLPDLQQYAAKAGGMKGKLSFQELIAAGSIHRDLGIASAESASGLEGLVGQAGTAGASKEKVEALSSIGLKPEDIDLIGENFDTMLGRLQGGLSTIPEEQREGVMKKVFEQAGVKFLKPLLEGRGTMQDRIAAMRDSEAGYAGAVRESEQGPGAVAVRQDVQKRRFVEKQDKNDTELRNELSQKNREAGESPFRVGLSETSYSAMRGIGISQETAAGWSFGGYSGSGVEAAQAKQALKAKGLEMPAFAGPGEASPYLALDTPVERATKQRDDAKADYDESSTSFFTSGATKSKMRAKADAAEAHLQRLIDALERNTAATQQNSSANGNGVETPPSPPPSVSLAN